MKDSKKKDRKYIPIHITYEMWKELRHMQERGEIKSLQDAGFKALQCFIENLK